MAGAPPKSDHRRDRETSPADPSARPPCTIAVTILFLSVFIVVPVVNVFSQALSKGFDAYAGVFYAESPPEGELSPAERRKLGLSGVKPEDPQFDQADHGDRRCRRPPQYCLRSCRRMVGHKVPFQGPLSFDHADRPAFSVSPVIARLILSAAWPEWCVGPWASNLTWPDPFSLHWRGFAQEWWPFVFTQSFTGIIFTPLAIALASIFVTFPLSCAR